MHLDEPDGVCTASVRAPPARSASVAAGSRRAMASAIDPTVATASAVTTMSLSVSSGRREVSLSFSGRSFAVRWW